MLARRGAGDVRPGVRLRVLSGRCRGGTRRSRKLLRRSGWRGSRASWAELLGWLARALSPSRGGAVLGKSAGRARAGGLRSPRAADPPPPRPRPRGPRQSAGLPGMPPGPRVGAALSPTAPPPPAPPPRSPQERDGVGALALRFPMRTLHPKSRLSHLGGEVRSFHTLTGLKK